MKQSVNFSTFQLAFESLRPDNFSRGGLSALFDYLEEFENDTGEELELDVIALCCDFAEDDAESIAKLYSIDLEEAESDQEAIADIVREYLQNEGAWVGDSGKLGEKQLIVYRNF